MTEDQIRQQREDLINDLRNVIESHKTDLASSLMTSDVVGAIECVKLEYYLSME